MNDENTNLDLLDLDGDASDSLPEVAFATPRPKKPWLLLGIGLVVIALATYIIVKTVSGPSSSSVEIDLDGEPSVVVDGGDAPVVDVNPQPLPVPSAAPVPQPVVVQPQPETRPMPDVKPEPVAQPAADVDSNVRVVSDRRDVVFDPNKASVDVKPVAKPAPKAAAKPVAKPAQKPVAKSQPKKVEKTAGAATWYVQFGSYATRDAANAAGAKMRAAHSSLFSGKQFVVLASVLKDGRTTYRLRVAFNNSNDANGFCRNAKSDGLDCYVAK